MLNCEAKMYLRVSPVIKQKTKTKKQQCETGCETMLSLVDQGLRRLARESNTGADKDVCQHGNFNPHSAVHGSLSADNITLILWLQTEGKQKVF